jgi:hypothetical protein
VTGREVWAGLELLDRQLLDRSGVLCGNVDDIELTEPDADGVVYVEALLVGPGILLERFGHARLGRWLRHLLDLADDSRTAAIPASLISDVGSAVTVATDADALASTATERWWRDHLIDHVPGGRRARG